VSRYAAGGSVENTATVRDVAGSRLTFHVQAVDGSGKVVAAGAIDRAIVDRQRFLASVSTWTPVIDEQYDWLT
jgi:fluoroacetyl-CoA thioesterase